MWETPWIQFFISCWEIPGDDEIQNMEITIRGMEIASASCPSFSTGLVSEELKGALLHVSEQICRKSVQVTHQEAKGSYTLSPTQTNLPAIFLLILCKNASHQFIHII